MIIKDMKKRIADKFDVSQDQAEGIYNEIVDMLYEEVQGDPEQSVRIPKIGSLKTSIRKAYTGKNPMTGEPCEISARRVGRITLCKALKDTINDSYGKGKKKASAKKAAPAKKATKATAKKAPAKKTVAKKGAKKK